MEHLLRTMFVIRLKAAMARENVIHTRIMLKVYKHAVDRLKYLRICVRIKFPNIPMRAPSWTRICTIIANLFDNTLKARGAFYKGRTCESSFSINPGSTANYEADLQHSWLRLWSKRIRIADTSNMYNQSINEK
jgi:hypothetical protein